MEVTKNLLVGRPEVDITYSTIGKFDLHEGNSLLLLGCDEDYQ